MSTKKRVFKKLAEETKVDLSAHKVELGSIEDAIKETKSEADKLWSKVNGYSANARDVSSSVARAEKTYKEALDAYNNFEKSEKKYKEELNYAERFFKILRSEGFKALNDYTDMQNDLRKYGIKISSVSTQSKEMLKAADDFSSIDSKFKKIK